MSKLKHLNFEYRSRLTDKAERRRAAAQLFPCLNSNNSIQPTQQPQEPAESPALAAQRRREQEQLNQFTTSHRKSAYALEQNVRSFIEHFGIDHVGFLTLTFADHVTDPKEAQRRFNSLRTNYLKHHYPHYIRVIERTKSGRIHYHLIVACKENIRRGLNFRQIARRDYSSANHAIRAHWESLRQNLPKYGFGRAELLPVKTNSKGLARYVAKYIGKHINSRTAEDKGIRLLQTSIDKAQRWKTANSNFQFLSEGSRQWRKKLQAWVETVNTYFQDKYRHYPRKKHTRITHDNYTTQLKALLSPKWAYLNQAAITATPI